MTEKRVVVNISRETDDAKVDKNLKQLHEAGGLRSGDVTGTRDGKFRNPLVMTVEGIQERRRLIQIMDFLEAKGNIASALNLNSLPPEEKASYVRYLEGLATEPGKQQYTLKNPRAYVSYLREMLISGGITPKELDNIDKAIAPVWGEKTLKGEGLGTGEIEFGPAFVVDVKDIPVPERTIGGTEAECTAEVSQLIEKAVEACARACADRIRLPKGVDTSKLNPQLVEEINMAGLTKAEEELAGTEEDRRRVIAALVEVREQVEGIKKEKLAGIVKSVLGGLDRDAIGDGVRFLLGNQIPKDADSKTRGRLQRERKSKFGSIFDGIDKEVARKVSDDIYGCGPSYEEQRVTAVGHIVIGNAEDIAVRICDPDHPCAEWATKQVFEGYIHQMPTQVLGMVETARDYIMEALTGTSKRGILLHTLENVKFDSVIVGDSFESILNTEPFEGRLAGVVEGTGSELSHFCISIKKARVPTVLRVGKRIGEIRTGELVVVDDPDGVVIVNPTPRTLSEIIEKREGLKARAAQARSIHLPAAIKGGPTIPLMANITREDDLVTKIVGLAEYGGVKYSFSASNVRDTVRIESQTPGEQTRILCSIRIEEPIPAEITGSDRQFVRWVKDINVDEEGNARKKARELGIEIHKWKRHTGATGMGAEGIGLFRTEHIVERVALELEAEHIQPTAELIPQELKKHFKEEIRHTIETYERESMRNHDKFIAARLSGRPEHAEHLKANAKKPIVFRIPDYGRDKNLPETLIPLVREYELDEKVRRTGVWPGGINFALQNEEIFIKPFLEAIREVKEELKAKGAEHDHEIHIMLPMTISPLDVRDTIAALKRAGIRHSDGIRIIPLLEKPETAVESTTELIITNGIDDEKNQWIISLCIGSNDLTSYTTGAERTRVSAKALDGLVIRPIASIIATGKKHGIPVGLCGEAGGDRANALAYASLGISYLSMDGGCIPEVKKAMRKVNFQELPNPAEIVDQATKYPDDLRRKMQEIAFRTEKVSEL
ncbi:MAG: hypothetical protein FJY77_02045 [Candidatus Altiarchaeales archaeon]|nr:hypothetical protein [Candidatus Altiarchaeales archaeon]